MTPSAASAAPLLVIDNYDSFTFNLVQFLGELGMACVCLRNDAKSVPAILRLRPRAIILSPGPGRPQQAGVCLDLIRRSPQHLPILGVCLGFQAIGEAFGGEIAAAPTIMHGKMSAIRHDGSALFADIPSPFMATRYHSLMLTPASVPACLRVSARCGELVMAVAHASRPVYGVQFHPESIATAEGYRLLANFCRLAGLRPRTPPISAAASLPRSVRSVRAERSEPSARRA